MNICQAEKAGKTVSQVRSAKAGLLDLPETNRRSDLAKTEHTGSGARGARSLDAQLNEVPRKENLLFTIYSLDNFLNKFVFPIHAKK